MAARVFNRNRMASKYDRVTASIQRKLHAESEQDLHRGMHFPTRWDPFFTDLNDARRSIPLSRKAFRLPLRTTDDRLTS